MRKGRALTCIVLALMVALPSAGYLAADTCAPDTFDYTPEMQPLSPGPGPGTLATLLSENFSAPWVPCGTGYDAPPGWEVDSIYTIAFWQQYNDIQTGFPTSNSTPFSAGVWWNDYNPTRDEWLILPELNLSASVNTTLYFNSIYTMPSYGADPAARDLIEVSTDGGANWTILADLAHDPQFEIPGAAGGPAGTHWCWYEMYLPGASAMPINLSAYDSLPSVKIAFHYDVLDSAGRYGLWCIDDVRVEAGYNSGKPPHAPIRINSNSEFDPAHGVSAGNGTVWAPWVIENYDINGAGYGYCIYIGNTTNYFVVRNCYLHHASGVYSEPYYIISGIMLYNVQNGNIANNNASSNNRDGILLYSYSRNNIIANNTVFKNTADGIILVDSSNNTIINNTATRNTAGIFLRPIFGVCNKNTINNNAVSYNYIGINLYDPSSNNIIVNNNASNCSYGISLSQACMNNIANNIASSNSQCGIEISLDSNGNTIANNTLSSNLMYGAIELWWSSSNIIFNNTMVGKGILIEGTLLNHWNTHSIDTSNTVNGKPVYYWKNQISGTIPTGAGQVIIANCTNVIVENQNISNGSIIGIILAFSSSNTIANNTASLNKYGIYLYFSNNNTVANNTVSSNSNMGIYLVSSSSNTIANNIASSNYFGIYLQSSSSNTIANNIASSNYGGIYIQSSSNNNTIYHNIISNTNQAYDDGINLWNDTYPTGGNYWSDYTGVDVKSGSLQDQLGSDGIGDTPYNILGGSNKDYYPLMSPIDYTEYSIPLQQGWNLISLPVRQLNESIDSALESIAGKWNYIQMYNASDTSDHWKSNLTYRPVSQNDLNAMNHLKGYWINITQPGVTLTVKGDKFGSALSIPLKAGWNLVSYPSLTPKSISVALAGTGYDSVEGFNASDPYRTSVLPGSYLMKPGEGYWVHVPADSVWIVNW